LEKEEEEAQKKEDTNRLINNLIHILIEFDYEVYNPNLENQEALGLYNASGGKALHMCMLLAYKYPQNSPERKALLGIVKRLIEHNDASNTTCVSSNHVASASHTASVGTNNNSIEQHTAEESKSISHGDAGAVMNSAEYLRYS
jgi:hypothetical protein